MEGLTTTQIGALAAAVAVCVAYPFFMRILASLSEPIRLRMADIGNELLASREISGEQKHLINRALDEAFDWWGMIIYVLILPLACVIVLVRPSNPFSGIRNRETQAKLAEFSNLHIRSLVAANPIFGIVFLVLVRAFILSLFPFKQFKGAMVKLAVTNTVDRIEDKLALQG